MSATITQRAARVVSRRDMTVSGRKVVPGEVIDQLVGHSFEISGGRKRNFWCYELDPETKFERCGACGAEFVGSTPLANHQRAAHEAPAPETRDAGERETAALGKLAEAGNTWALWVAEGQAALERCRARVEDAEQAVLDEQAKLRAYRQAHTPEDDILFDLHVEALRKNVRTAQDAREQAERERDAAIRECRFRRTGPMPGATGTYEPLGAAHGTGRRGRR